MAVTVTFVATVAVATVPETTAPVTVPVKLVADRAPVAGLYFKPECVSISWDPVAPSTSVKNISVDSLLLEITSTFVAFVAVLALPNNAPWNVPVVKTFQ